MTDTTPIEEEVVVKKPSKGSIFKKKNGYSKTIKRLMNKHKVKSVEEYRKIRKVRKQEETKDRQRKRSNSTAYKRLNGRTGAAPKKKEKVVKSSR